MRIAIDAMGGDHGPLPIVEGALRAAQELGPSLDLVFVGREDQVREAFRTLPRLAAAAARATIEPASEVVGMTEAPTVALRRKKDSSIRRAAELVAAHTADGVVSAGPTGAVAATMAVVVGLVPGVDRAAIAAILPTVTSFTCLVDVGANVDCKPFWLVQFAVMGRLLSELALGTESPRVGLLSIGEEETKGNELTREAHALLRKLDLGFIGNIEGKDVFAGKADVVVCDGFVGNIVLKVAESLPPLFLKVMREEVDRSLVAKLGMGIARPALRGMRERLDWESYGGAPLLGVDGACIICHGRSGAKAIRNAVRVAHDFVAGRVKERIAEKLKEVA